MRIFFDKFFLFLVLIVFCPLVANAAKYTLVVGDANASEANYGSSNTLNFTISVAESLGTATLTVQYRLENNDAIAGDDYTSTSGSLTFTSGTQSQSVNVSTIGDDYKENNETFDFVLYNYAVTGSGNSIETESKGSRFTGIGTIINDDTAIVPNISIDSPSVIEGNNSIGTTLDFTVTLDQSSLSDINITYEATQADASVSQALENVDYNATSGTLVFLAGETSKTISIPIIGDTDIEGNEYFHLTLLNVTTNNAIIDKYQGIGTIVDDDDIIVSTCSPYIGKLVLNEYNNIPTVKDQTGTTVPGLGTFIEIKRLDDTFQPAPEEDWTITVYDKNNNTQASFDFSERDLYCGKTTPYIIFDLASNQISKDATVIIRDEKGREVDVLYVGAAYEPSKCLNEGGNFIYDIDFPSEADNKDIFRRPDGIGNWTDAGSGANSGATRCINPGGDNTGFLDAMNRDITVYSNGNRNITTKITNKDIELKAVSVESGALFDMNITVYAWTAEATGVGTYEILDPLEELTFNNTALVDFSNFTTNYAAKDMKIGFQYCEENGTVYDDWKSCWQTLANSSQRKISYSSDNFAIRPKSFSFSTAPHGKYLKAAKDYTISLTAIDQNNNATTGYDQNKSLITITPVKLLPDGSEDNASNPLLNGTLTFGTPSFSFVNGVSTPDADIKYTDVGVIDINITDTNWASVDADDTPAGCGTTDYYICGDEGNITFIPDRFEFKTLELHNFDGKNFTYYARPVDINMSGRIATNIQALNFENDITKNFSTGLWENSVSITPVVKDNLQGDATETTISNILVGFTDGNLTIDHNETNASIYLRFNFDRNQSIVLEPTEINSTELNISIVSTYGAGTVDETNATGSRDQNASNSTLFYYGRVHSPDISGVSPVTAVIRYEIYCKDCNKTDFNITGPQSPDVAHWYENIFHDDLTPGSVTLNAPADSFVSVGDTTLAPKNSTTILDGKETNTLTDPSAPRYYVDRIQMFGSPWLIYNPFNSTIGYNDFTITFYGASGWAGQGKLGETIDANISRRENKKMEW